MRGAQGEGRSGGSNPGSEHEAGCLKGQEKKEAWKLPQGQPPLPHSLPLTPHPRAGLTSVSSRPLPVWRSASRSFAQSPGCREKGVGKPETPHSELQAPGGAGGKGAGPAGTREGRSHGRRDQRRPPFCEDTEPWPPPPHDLPGPHVTQASEDGNHDPPFREP